MRHSGMMGIGPCIHGMNVPCSGKALFALLPGQKGAVCG